MFRCNRLEGISYIKGLVIALLALFFLGSCRMTVPEDVGHSLTTIKETPNFNFDVRPILSDHCFPCHGPDPDQREANLRFDTEEGAFAVLDDSLSYAIVPGRPGDSKLIQRILSNDPSVVMPPPEAKLDLHPYQKAVLYRWIKDGAEWEPHWAFIPPEKSSFPPVRDQKWARNEIDYFVLHALETIGLQPSPAAEKRTLVRRVFLDLIGLPPTMEEVNAFLNDQRPTSYEHLIDRLLASPHFGERWCWEWLDAARYADTNGFQGDPERKMWPWRDWVINAINDNMPYDQFSIEQLAGDMLSDATTQQILATAFNRNHMYNGEGGRIPEETRVENVFDRTETVGTIWLGMTLNCCRCHDHKFDQITQKEYYEFYDFFNQTSEEGIGYNGRIKPILDLSPVADQAKIKEIENFIENNAEDVYRYEKNIFPRHKNLSAAESPNAAQLNGDNIFALGFHPGKRNPYYLGLLVRAYEGRDPEYVRLLNALRSSIRKKDQLTADNLQVMVMDHLDRPRPTYILERGSYDKRGEKVHAGIPTILARNEEAEPQDRLELANWLFSPSHPLTSRVAVNRFWQTIFGQGLVKTPEDFGAQGAKPTHPRLLDWLARDFVDHGWDVKRLIKKIVMSATYQQSSHVDSVHLLQDPDNQWLARMSRLRLPSWMIRDQALAVSGLLVDSLGGPPVKPYQPAGVWAEATFGFKKYEQDHGADLYRRTLYTFWRRIVAPTVLFDNASRQVCTVKPIRTNTPLHALTTLNDVTYVEAARVMAQKAIQEWDDEESRLQNLFTKVTARRPTAVELQILGTRLKLLQEEYHQDIDAANQLLQVGEYPQNESLDPALVAAYTGICSLLLNLDEVVTRQ